MLFSVAAWAGTDNENLAMEIGKTRTYGKKHKGDLLKGYIDGETAGNCEGFEIHSKKKTLALDKVGFYYSKGNNPMTKMRFAINVYDMANVKEDPTNNFVSVLKEPIYFDFNPNDVKGGKFVYQLPEKIVLPKDAMVSIEMLDDLDKDNLWYRSNMVGKKYWFKTKKYNTWSKNPFATPYFIKCVELKAKKK